MGKQKVFPDPILEDKNKEDKNKKRFKTPGEKAQSDLDLFIQEVMSRLAMLETYYMLISKDLSVTITAVKAIKSLMEKKKLMTDKQFNKEYEKLYQEMIEIVKEAEDKYQSEELANEIATPDEFMKIILDPNIAHS